MTDPTDRRSTFAEQFETLGVQVRALLREVARALHWQAGVEHWDCDLCHLTGCSIRNLPCRRCRPVAFELWMLQLEAGGLIRPEEPS